MRRGKRLPVFAIGIAALALVGCGPSKEELAAHERARLEIERQAQEDAAKANKAITEMNKKMFSKMNASRTGSPATPPPEQPPAGKP